MIDKLIATAILSLGTSAIGRFRNRNTTNPHTVLAATLRALPNRDEIIRQLRACPTMVLSDLSKAEGMTATWCKCRTEMETFLADKYSSRR